VAEYSARFVLGLEIDLCGLLEPSSCFAYDKIPIAVQVELFARSLPKSPESRSNDSTELLKNLCIVINEKAHAVEVYRIGIICATYQYPDLAYLIFSTLQKQVIKFNADGS
jgi:hypothetical protein